MLTLSHNKTGKEIHMVEEKELIKHIYKDSEMGSYTIEVLLKDLKDKDNKIKKYAQELLNQYQEFTKRSKEYLKCDELPKVGRLNKVGARIGINKEIEEDNSDSRIADMLIKGLSMGSIDMEKKIVDYKNVAGKDSLRLASDFQNFQKAAIEKLKEYL
jgi:hypothetical protein